MSRSLDSTKSRHRMAVTPLVDDRDEEGGFGFPEAPQSTNNAHRQNALQQAVHATATRGHAFPAPPAPSPPSRLNPSSASSSSRDTLRASNGSTKKTKVRREHDPEAGTSS